VKHLEFENLKTKMSEFRCVNTEINKDELVEGNKVIKNSNDHLQPSLAQQRACGPRGKKNVIDASSASAYDIC
jgi:hypothetical protein